MRAFLFFLVKAHIHGHYRTINGIKKWIDPYEDKRPSAKPKIKTKGKDRKTEDLFDPRMSGDLYDPVAVREARKQIPAKPEKPKTVPVLFVRPDQPDLFGDNDLALYSKMRNTESEPAHGDSVMSEENPLLSVKATGKQSRGKWIYTVTMPDGAVSEFKSDTRYSHIGVVETGPAAKNPGVVKHIASLESPGEIAAWTEKALKSPAHARALAVPIELTEAKPPKVKKVTEKTVDAPAFDRSRVPNGSTWGDYTLEISGVGRKWLKVKLPGKSYEMQAELNNVSADWKPGDTVTFYGAKHVESDRYGTKTTYYPAPADIRQAVDEEKAVPEIKRWLGYVEEKAPSGYVYQNGVDKLRALGIDKHPELKSRMDAAIAKAKEVRAAQEKQWAEEKAARVKERETERAKAASTPKQRILYPDGAAPSLNVPVRRYGKVIVFESTGKPFRIDEDAPSLYGSHLLGHEGDYGRYYYYRDATPDEIAQLEQREAEAQAKQEAAKQLAAIKADIKARGERPDGSNVPEGVRVHDTQNLYGSGDWFVVGSDWIWYVQNNGMDGDDWAVNNVRTGGAGAIGWRVPYDPELAAKLGVKSDPKPVPVLFAQPRAVSEFKQPGDSKMTEAPEKLESTGYTATLGDYVGRARALLSKNGKTMSVWDDTPAEPLPEQLKAAVRATGADPATRVMVRERALGINMVIEKDFYDQIKAGIAAKQAELDAQPERIMAKLVAQRKALAEEVGYIAEAAHEDHVRRVERMSATGVGGKPKRDYDAEDTVAREALAKFDAEHPEVLEKIEADKKADTERNMWN
jgi:hypothetical protein